MSEQIFRQEPMNIDSETWYYEEKKGICVVREVWIAGKLATTEQFYIPWKRLLESVKRKYPKALKGKV